MALFRRRAGFGATLARLDRDLAAARTQVSVIEEQLASLRDDADDLSVRSIVSENTADVRDARQAQGHVDRHQRQLTRLRERIASLEAAKHELLNRPIFDD